MNSTLPSRQLRAIANRESPILLVQVNSEENARLGHPHHWETLMPLFTVTMKAGRAPDEKNAISRAIHEASVEAGYPDDDMFQRFFVLSRPT